MVLTEQQVYQWLFEAVRQKNRVGGVGEIHVSEVVSCLRRSYYMRTRSLTISPRSAVILLGDSIHGALQNVLRRYGYYTEHQVSLQLDGFRFVGNIDAYHPEEEVVLEIKTVYSIPKQPFENHSRQATIYARMVSAKRCYLVYISRGDGGVKLFKLEPDKSILKWAVERARTLRACLIARQPPPREKSILCNYCEFALHQCRVREDGAGE